MRMGTESNSRLPPRPFVHTIVHTKVCINCGAEISAARRSAIPSASRCIACSEANDVEKTIGILTWDHKTAPTLQLSTEVGFQAIRTMQRYSRKGYHASLPLVSKSAAEKSLAASSQVRLAASIRDAIFDLECIESDARFIPAKCHPERPALANGRCVECCVAWYARRIVR